MKKSHVKGDMLDKDKNNFENIKKGILVYSYYHMKQIREVLFDTFHPK